MICRLFVQASPQDDQHDAKFKEAILTVDMALRHATDAGKKVSASASNAFAEAQKMLLRYEESAHPRSIANIVSTMTQAKAIDQRSLGLFNRLRAGRVVGTPNVPPTLTVNFVLLKSLPDPKPLIVHQFLSDRPKTSEILWNFSRYQDDRRILLRQNPQFYLDLPTSFGADFVKDATKDFRFKRNDTVYVLVDKPDLGRIYLEAENGKRMFGNVWKPNDVLIFKDIRGRLEGEQLVGNDIPRKQELFWRDEPELNVSSAKPWELQEDPWQPVTDTRDWKELIQEKTLPSTRTSVKICVSHANHLVTTSDEGSRASDKRAVNPSSQGSNVPSASNTTHASSSVHVGSHDNSLGVPPSHSAGTQSLPKTQAQTTALATAPPNGHAHGSKPISAAARSSPMPMSTPSVSPPPPAHTRAPPITATPHTITQSPSHLPGHPSKLPVALESQNNASSPLASAPPSLSSGTIPSSKPTGVTPVTNPGPVNLPTQPHLPPVSNNVKPTSKQSRTTKVVKPVQETKAPPKSTKSSITISTFTHKIFQPSMPGAFPGPEMDTDWVTVSHGPAEIQGGNWLKRLFRRPG